MSLGVKMEMSIFLVDESLDVLKCPNASATAVGLWHQWAVTGQGSILGIPPPPRLS